MSGSCSPGENKDTANKATSGEADDLKNTAAKIESGAKGELPTE